MSKMPLSWHKNNLKNAKDTNAMQEAQLEVLTEIIEERKTDIEFRELQIKTAIEQKKRGFDQDRYLLNHREK